MRNPLIALAAVAALVGTPALAAESKTISYRDLDLSSASGRQELDRRISAAARSLCDSSAIETGTLLRSRKAQSCYKEASAAARAAIAAQVKEDRLGG